VIEREGGKARAGILSLSLWTLYLDFLALEGLRIHEIGLNQNFLGTTFLEKKGDILTI